VKPTLAVETTVPLSRHHKHIYQDAMSRADPSHLGRRVRSWSRMCMTTRRRMRLVDACDAFPDTTTSAFPCMPIYCNFYPGREIRIPCTPNVVNR